MEMRTSLGRDRGLGSAKEGVGHWWAQRVTAIALVPLSIWFVCSANADCDATCGSGLGRCVHARCPIRICKCG